MIYKVTFAFALLILQVHGHGMMLDPPNRSSLWRFDEASPANYNDNENFCGGINVLWDINHGKCGVCGDAYTDSHPQSNENTGFYGQGKIVANYTPGQIIETSILITANHLGYFEYHLCDLQEPSTIEAGEECFQRLEYKDGSVRYPIEGHYYEVINEIKLPEDFTCERCVLRWQYIAGNNWGECPNGEILPGCGPQEMFRSCADVTIN